MTGISRISAAFETAQKFGRSALMPYFTLGYPDLESSLAIVEAIARSGADLIELGVPFSDPLADGPTIQHSTQTALGAGADIPFCLQVVRRLRDGGIQTPLLLMGYINPVLSYGVERFVVHAASAGVDGLILPDLPPEEAGQLEAGCREHNLALVYLLSPASTPERIRLVVEHSSGFVYLVSVLGVTGARPRLAIDLEAFIQRVRAETQLPLAVGFGISTPEQAARVGSMADGVIVGSALIQTAANAADPAQACATFVRALRDGVEQIPAAGPAL